MIDDARFTQRQADILAAATDAARSFGGEVYIIGGPVRDALLARPVRDLDFTVSADATEFARELARRIDGRVSPESRFLTTKVIAGEEEIDVTTLRRETYSRPGALPDVMAGTLADDLSRRDFAANAIALDLRTGEIFDPLGGRDDIAARQLRVLHEQSFLEDPTRIFRAIRLRHRLRFSIERATDRLADEAIAGGALQTISSDRFWREVVFVFEEDAAGALLADLSARGVLQRIAPETDARSREQLPLLDAILTGELRDIDRVFVHLAVLLNRQPAGHLSQFPLPHRFIRRLGSVPQSVDQALAALETAPDPLTIEAPLEELVLAAIAEPRHLDAVRMIASFRSFPIPVRGSDLGVPPGPHIAKALLDTRRALFREEIAPAGAVGFARRRALQYLDSSDGRSGSGGETANQ